MLEGLILGIIQGITEWLPVSSEGILTLVGIKFFGKDLAGSVSMAVFLHLGTFWAALIYFRKDVFKLLNPEYRTILHFLVLSTLVTGLVGFPILGLALSFFNNSPAWIIIAIIGFSLIITGLIQFKKSEITFRTSQVLNKKDAVIVGGLQGFSVLPGLSRSGLTIAGFLFRKFQETEALRLSFLMSLPAVLGGSVALQIIGHQTFSQFGFSSVVALAVAFAVGLITIHFLLKISRKINFGWFAIGFGVLTLLSLLFI